MKQLAGSRSNKRHYLAAILFSLLIVCSMFYLLVFRVSHESDIIARTVLLLSHKCEQITTKSERANMMNDKQPNVPKIMHRLFGFWDSKLPKGWKASLESCHEEENDFQLMTWNRSTSTHLIATHYPWFLSRFESYKYDVQRADAARYFILFHYGGFYLDMDIKCVNKSVLSLFYKNLIEKSASAVDSILLPTDPYGVTNFFMVAQKCSQIMRLTASMLEYSDRWYGIPYFTVMFSTGPVFLTRVHEKFVKSEPDMASSVVLLQQNQFWNSYFIDSGKEHGTWHTWDAAPLLLVYDHSYVFTAVFIFIIIFVAFVLVKVWYHYRSEDKATT